jgi:SPP1 gp7 family putative phage head morphogenesis protein
VAEWDWDEEGNKDLVAFINFLLPQIFKSMDSAFEEVLGRARFFVSFRDLTRYIILALEQKVRLSAEVKARIGEELDKVYEQVQKKTLDDIGYPLRFEFGIADRQTISYALKLQDFYLGKFFQGDKEIRLRVLNWMNNYYLERGNPIGRGQQGIKEFLNEFGQYIQPQTEWKARQVIDTSLNHLRNAAQIRALEKAGIKTYRWVAVGDRLTCPICRSMDGRIFEVKDAVRVLNMLEESEDPTLITELKPIMKEPWKGSSKAAPTKQPPAHPLCRCRLVADSSYLEERALPVTLERPQGIPDTPLQRELEEEFSLFTNAEIANRIRAHLGTSWQRMSKGGFDEESKNMQAHFAKHAQMLGVKNLKEYEKLTYEIIKKPDRVYVQRLSNGETDYLFIKGDRVAVSNDDGLFVKSVYRLYINEEEWIKDAVKKGRATIKLL